MTIGAFETSIAESVNVLKKINFFKRHGIKVTRTDGVSKEFLKASTSGSYVDAYRAAMSNHDYDILLFDNSFIQIGYNTLSKSFPQIRLAYFQNPQPYFTYNEYLTKLRIENIIENETDEEIGEALLEEYEQFLLEQNLDETITTIRYDLDMLAYRPKIHSVSHFHFGHTNNVRIPCDKIITPLKFILFVVKHIYYNQWKRNINTKESELLKALTRAKSACLKLKEDYWSASEQLDLFLT